MRGNNISRSSKGGSTPIVVWIAGDLLRESLLDALTVDENSFGVTVVESIARGYSRIKQLTPDLVVVILEIDDADACQLLAMLRLDSDVSSIPVVTCVASRQGSDSVNDAAGMTRSSPGKAVTALAN